MQHKFLTLAAAVAAAWVFGLPALAAGGAGVYGTVQGQDAVLYLRSGSADAAYTCMVGNTPVTPAKATPLSGLDTPARTVILLDNSAAISERPGRHAPERRDVHAGHPRGRGHAAL